MVEREVKKDETIVYERSTGNILVFIEALVLNLTIRVFIDEI